MGGVNSNRHGSDGGHSLPQGILVTWRHVYVARAFGADVLGLEAALSILIQRERERIPRFHLRLHHFDELPLGGSVARCFRPLHFLLLKSENFTDYLSLIRVGLLRVDAAVLLDVLEGAVHQTSAAAHVAVISGAVDQLLLAQRHQLPGLPVVLAFKGSSLKDV